METIEKVISGVDVTVSFEEDGIVYDIGGQGEANLKRESQIIDITTKDSNGKREYITVSEDWEIGCDGFYITNNKALGIIHRSMNNQLPLVCVVTVGDGYKMRGTCFVTSVETTYPEKDEVAYVIKFKGSGNLEELPVE